MRMALKAAAENLLVTAGVPRLGVHRRRTGALILAYHNIVPDGQPVAGEISLHLPQRDFAAQLDTLSRYCDIVPLDHVFDGPTPGRADRPRVAITFDDAYRGAVSAGVDELARRGLPATIFVAPGLLGTGSFWWDRYCPAGSGTLPPEFREVALGECRGLDAAVRAQAIAQGFEAVEVPDHATAATEEELCIALDRGPVVLGSHTWSHANLTAISPDELADELARPLKWLRDRFESVAPWVSYPYGLSSSTARSAAARVGYAGGLKIKGGWIPSGTNDTFAVSRLNVPSGLSNGGFALRISGLFSR